MARSSSPDLAIRSNISSRTPCEGWLDVPSLTEDVVIVTNARHYDALVRAHAHLQRVIDGLSAGDSSLSALHPSLPPDLLSEDLRQALDTLAEITGGQITPNEVLENIFTKFCVGK